MDTTQPQQIIQGWHVFQRALLLALRNQLDPQAPKRENVNRTLEWLRIGTVKLRMAPRFGTIGG